MDFIWDAEKNAWLKAERLVSFEEIAAIIQARQYLQVIDNPARPDQHCFLLRIRNYTRAVPFVFDAEDRIVLKTAYPSRKFHRLYGEQRGNEED